jgi:hypothetical protein
MGRITNWWERPGSPCKVVKTVESCALADPVCVTHICGLRVWSVIQFLKSDVGIKKT